MKSRYRAQARSQLLALQENISDQGSEVLSGKCALSMTMVRRLRARFDISADLLIPAPPKARQRRRLAA